MNKPSVKKLSFYFGEEKGKALRNLLTKKTKTTDYKSVNDYIQLCYRKPSYRSRLMVALDEILEGYGVEFMPGKQEGQGYEYVNMGDTYAITLLMDIETGRVFISTMGDVAERKGL